MDSENLQMLSDFYEFTMSQGYFLNGFYKKKTYFDLFYRSVPDDGGFVIACGLEQVIDYIENLKFTKENINFLRKKGIFEEAFLEYLINFKFTGDIYAVPEGTVVFPNEPLLTVKAPAIEAQLIETALLLFINHQSLIATKANRIVRAARGRAVLEFGARRAQGVDGAVIGARAAYIGGCTGTSNLLTDVKFGINSSGTMAHSWVQMFDTEYEAFKTYAQIYPENCTLLVDTYDTLHSGIPNAIKVFTEELVPKGFKDFAIRLDSGDIAYLSKQARKMLDRAGLDNCKIIASNSLDEYLIRDLMLQDAKIDAFGVGERLITSKSNPVLGGVYKLVAIEDDNKIIPKVKISENISKITTPHYKKVYRLYCNKTHNALADLITLHDEVIDETSPIEIFHPEATWKRKTITDFTAKPLLVPIFIGGKLVYEKPSIDEIRAYAQSDLNTIWDEVKRFEYPHKYYVDLSQKLWEIKQELLSRNSVNNEKLYY